MNLLDDDDLVVAKEYKEIQPAYDYPMAAQTSGGTRNKKYPKKVKGNKEILQPETPKLDAKKPVRVKPKSKPQEKASVNKSLIQQRSTIKDKVNKNDSETEQDTNNDVDVMDVSPILESRDGQDKHEYNAMNKASALKIATRATKEEERKKPLKEMKDR